MSRKFPSPVSSFNKSLTLGVVLGMLGTEGICKTTTYNINLIVKDEKLSP